MGSAVLDSAPCLTALVAKHTVSEDGKTWEFELRPDAKFHDGSEVTADDVVYSFRRVLAIGKAPSGAFKPVLKPDNVTAPDKHTVRFVLDQAYAPFLSAVPIVMIVNPRAVKANESNNDWAATWLASNAAGSGAYKLDASTYRPLERVDLKPTPTISSAGATTRSRPSLSRSFRRARRRRGCWRSSRAPST